MMRDKINQRFFKWANKTLDHVDIMETKISLNVICEQIAASATSAAANYRASGRVKSIKYMINKLKIAEEETDETIYWLEILDFRTKKYFSNDIKEGNELLAIVVSSIISLRRKIN